MKTRSQSCVLLLAACLGCTRVDDPCPPGKFLQNDECVLDEPDTSMEGIVEAVDAASPDDEPAPPGLDATDPHPMEPTDAAPDGAENAEPDASLDAEPELDAGSDTEPASQTDAQLDASPDDGSAREASAGDAQPDARAPSQCNAADTQTWEDFHLGAQLASEFSRCSADARCSSGACDVDSCLREQLIIGSCSECIAQEVACITATCSVPCASSIDSAACRACICRQDCVPIFRTCSGASADLCADCAGTSCAYQSLLPPELITAAATPLL